MPFSSEMTIASKSLGLSHSFFLLDMKHLLSISLVRNEEPLVPIFVLVQQPSFGLKYHYDSNPKAFALVTKEKIKDGSAKPFALPSLIGGGGIIIDAVPISIRLPTGTELDLACGSQEQNNAISSVVKMKVEVVGHWRQLSRYDRQRNWYISVRRRPLTGHKDTFYVHLQSDLQFRSLVEVYSFIVDGKRPTTGLSKATKEGSKRIRGSSLIEKKEVGQYDHDNKFIYRWQTMPTESLPGTPESAETSGVALRTGAGSRKRKREADTSAPNGQNSPVANSGTSEPTLYPLYDFLLKGI